MEVRLARRAPDWRWTMLGEPERTPSSGNAPGVDFAVLALWSVLPFLGGESTAIDVRGQRDSAWT